MGGCTCHAECAVLHKLLKLKIQTNPKIINQSASQYTSHELDKMENYVNQLLVTIAMKRCYSLVLKPLSLQNEINFNQSENEDHDITIVKYNLEDFNPTVITAGQRWISKLHHNINYY